MQGGKGVTPTEEALYQSVGLIPRHAYSVLRLYCSGDVQLVQLRNPWGRYVGWWCGAVDVDITTTNCR